jgi:hypothetical protein
VTSFTQPFKATPYHLLAPSRRPRTKESRLGWPLAYADNSNNIRKGESHARRINRYATSCARDCRHFFTARTSFGWDLLMYLRGGAGTGNVSYSLSTGSCSDLNGRSCHLRASDPAGQAAGIGQSARLSGCQGWTDAEQRKQEEDERRRQLERSQDLFKSRK